MKKWIIRFSFALALMILVFLIGAPRNGTWWVVTARPGAEIAMPSPPKGSSAVLVKVENVEYLQKRWQWFDTLLSEYLHKNDDEGWQKYGRNAVTELLEVADELAFLICLGDGRFHAGDEPAYLAFYASEAKKDSFEAWLQKKIDAGGSWRTWKTERGSGWMLSDERLDPDAKRSFGLYILKPKDGPQNFFLATFFKEDIEAMLDAHSDREARFEVQRQTLYPNYVRWEGFSFAPESLPSLNFELSWMDDGGVLRTQVYSDGRRSLFSHDLLLPEKGYPGSADIPLVGGEVAIVFSVDVPTLLSVAIQGGGTPLAAVSGKMNELPQRLKEKMLDVMRQGRLYFVVTTSEAAESMETAYFVLQSGAPEALADLYGAIALFIGERVALEGWDSAYVKRTKSGQKGFFAKSGEFVIIGLGGTAQYGRKATLPQDVRGVLDSDASVSCVLTPAVLRLNKYHISDAAYLGLGESNVYARLLETAKMNVSSITVEVRSVVRADVTIYMGEDETK